jgi:hypothetical protein
MTLSTNAHFKDPDLRGAAAALQRAAQRALALSIQSGTPCLVMVDGKLVDLTKQVESIAVQGREAKRPGFPGR